MKIKEVIVVEGKSDTIAIQRATGADTIETNGSAVGPEIIERIRHAHETRGVIVFTDPDFPGRKIRAAIEEQIPGVKHAFLEKSKTVAKNGRSLGVEHATDEDIRAAIAAVYTIDESPAIEIPFAFLLAERLIGHPDAKKRRDRLATFLKIGQVNGKGLKKRLEMFRIDQNKIQEALSVLGEEEDL